ncbi:methionyl-tRNA formyltransferase [Clostridiales Family XIII bacterium PM5-7]
MKIVFMGTPEFSVPVLEAIINAGHEVGYVITQPDKAKNRGKKVQFTPVKEVALNNHIEVLQPQRIKNDEATMNLLRDYEPDIIVVVAYGQLLAKDLLDLPKWGCVNVHASLLPKLRGASPIQHAILLGEEKTGVTIMQMEEGLDTGDMLAKAELPIENMNGQELHDALGALGAELLVATLPKIQAGDIAPEQQDDELSTYAGMITKQDGRIDFTKTPEEIERKIRAFNPWPGAFCQYEEMQLKIWRAECILGKSEALPGTILAATEAGIDIACGNGILRAIEIQLPGKKKIEVSAFLKGNRIEKHTVLR